MKLLCTCSLAVLVCLLAVQPAPGQQRNYNPGPMNFDVGRVNVKMNKLNGDGGLQSQYSWNLTPGGAAAEIFYWPQDQYYSNMLYQIFNPLSLDDNGILDENGVQHPMMTRGDALTNYGATDWAMETRRYRPPHVTVDGIGLDAPYRWSVDPALKSDIKIEFEDVLGQFGIRSHVEMFGFSNADHGDYFIWKATQKFTGELKLPRQTASSKDSLPDQTIRFWWPLAFSFGPCKAGERAAFGGFSYEGEDDLDSWFRAKSTLAPAGGRDSLTVGYYWDSRGASTRAYPNSSTDDTGDPDRTTGHLYSTQIPGFTLLHADKSVTDRSDDLTQPYAMAHGSIVADLWGRRDVGLRQTYRGDDARGRFPLDPVTALFSTGPQKGPMRFVTVGPRSLTKNTAQHRYDSLTFVYAVGVGSISWQEADSIGRTWLAGKISDSTKDTYIMRGRDSLLKTLDRANWAWNRMTRGFAVPAAPPPPDITVTSGPDLITVNWSYPDASYFRDAVTGVDDWQSWKVYRKRGAFLVNDPLDQGSGARWELVFQTTDRPVTSYVDRSVQRGTDYYYAVTATDNGTQNPDDIVPNQKLESSMYATRSGLPAASYKPGLSDDSKVRVVPNPATSAAGALGFAGTPDKILLVNLPYKCLLRIYTETGDLVTSIQHLGTADDTWNQRTNTNQYVASGIYILVVSDAAGVDGKALDNQFVKFVIVR